jgi:hypothetical protein
MTAAKGTRKARELAAARKDAERIETELAAAIADLDALLEKKQERERQAQS